VSLAVSALGIANVTLVTVMERTAESGCAARWALGLIRTRTGRPRWEMA
jgi:hypothetical protein